MPFPHLVASIIIHCLEILCPAGLCVLAAMVALSHDLLVSPPLPPSTYRDPSGSDIDHFSVFPPLSSSTCGGSHLSTWYKFLSNRPLYSSSRFHHGCLPGLALHHNRRVLISTLPFSHACSSPSPWIGMTTTLSGTLCPLCPTHGLYSVFSCQLKSIAWSCLTKLVLVLPSWPCHRTLIAPSSLGFPASYHSPSQPLSELELAKWIFNYQSDDTPPQTSPDSLLPTELSTDP